MNEKRSTEFQYVNLSQSENWVLYSGSSILDLFFLYGLKVTVTRVNTFFSSKRVENQKLKQTTATNDSRAAVWLSFWFSTRPLADTGTD